MMAAWTFCMAQSDTLKRPTVQACIRRAPLFYEGMAAVVYWTQDLLFVSKIRETARQVGLDVEGARDAAALTSAARAAKIVILDLRRPEALAVLDALAADPQTRAVAKVGFIDHERVDVMESARDKGCKALAKGKFSTELPLLLAAL
jgi:CheY-like chemotaxis protein